MRRLPPQLELFAAALALLGASGCDAPKRGAADQALPPQVTLYGVRLQSWDRTGLVSTGRAARLTYDRSSSRFEAAESLMRFPSRGRPGDDQKATADLELRAPVTSGSLMTKQAQARGGVTVRSSSGLKGFTEEASFDGQALMARSVTRTRVEGPGYTVHADGFTFYFATEELIFDGNVESRLGQPEQSESVP